MQCFMCLNQIEPTDEIYRLKSDPYHSVCEECSRKEYSLAKLSEDYINEVFCDCFSLEYKTTVVDKNRDIFDEHQTEWINELTHYEAQDTEEYEQEQERLKKEAEEKAYISRNNFMEVS